MVPVIRVKPGVQFAVIAPAGFRILWALHTAALAWNHDLTITSGTDGEHSGPNDPHHRGEAYDVRSHDLPSPTGVLGTIMANLGETLFFGWLEAAGTDNEHLHIQLRHGTVYP